MELQALRTDLWTWAGRRERDKLRGIDMTLPRVNRELMGSCCYSTELRLMLCDDQRHGIRRWRTVQKEGIYEYA